MMVKKILEFNCDNPDDMREFDLANSGRAFAHTLYATFEAMQRWLRRKSRCPLPGWDEERENLPPELVKLIKNNPEEFRGLLEFDPEVLRAFFRASVDFTMEGMQKFILEEMDQEHIHFDMIS
ncbi:MAG: hypothetical protein ABFE07_28275 [Armatimonadia bacterium]